MRRSLLTLLAVFLAALSAAYAQQKAAENRLSLSLSHARLDSLVSRIEAQIPVRFYYDATSFDSLDVDLNVSNIPLDQLLDQLFRNTAFHYAIDADGNVFLTKGWTIQTGLAPAVSNQLDSARRTSIRFGEEKNARHKESSESKLYDIGPRTNTFAPGKAVISGVVRNARTGEPIANVVISPEPPGMATVTDRYGYYSISLPRGHHTLNVQGLGLRDSHFQLMLYSDGKMDMDLREQVTTLREVIVSSQKTLNVNRVQLGVEQLNIQQIKQVPTVMGEADILRVVLTLPGVKSVGEASTGLNVRGSSADQNLILFNDATIYNPSHFFGFFSAFNPEVVKGVELYKSSIPAQYGGRVASVLDVTAREGNKKEFTGSAGIGLLTSRVTIEGPLDKDKTSFIAGGRATYADWLLNLLPQEYKHSKASFSDFNLLISHNINEKNNLYLSGYLSNDRFNLNSDTFYKYGNRDLNIKWKHTFSNKVTGAYTLGYDRYQYNISSDGNPVNGFKLSFDINQFNLKADHTWYLNARNTVDFGLNSIRYILHPGNYEPYDTSSLVTPNKMQPEYGQENAIYVSDRITVNPVFSVVAGIRYSLFGYLGPHTENLYPEGQPKTVLDQIGTAYFAGGKLIKTYQGPEYRLSARYALTNSFSIKAGYNSLRQYTHMLSNTTSMAPTDIWKLSDPHIRPQLGDQLSLGLYKNMASNTIETSVEVYYKHLHDYLDYRSGATLILNPHIETDVLNSKGKAYGVELSIRKTAGHLTGWLSYTWSRTFLKTDDPTAGEIVNHGNWYPADFDIPNDFSAAINYRLNHRFSISGNFLYYTGRPITLPIAEYYYANSARVLYSDRNAYRIPDYFRTDLSLNLDGNYKVHQRTHNSWTIGVYNLTGRKNPYNVYFLSENGGINGYKLSIFGSAIPFINFNIRF
ncbi:MAG TPA: carboxypeptidase-like regulatory domain-containing protein [Puia sp.]|uniref:TonB-dependent receptor n=1 Tax=Puia sp. TaxID=2045100 RepID=UPI002CCA1868|nr:carboxypeptidase-like regulatory domain-containing protein [Puia sp.]HVU95179.1 carboxypeptidase-like regulatory domain-containing protein [Puia sp.]